MLTAQANLLSTALPAMYDISRSVTAGKNSYPASGCFGLFRLSLWVSGQWVMFSLIDQNIRGQIHSQWKRIYGHWSLVGENKVPFY